MNYVRLLIVLVLAAPVVSGGAATANSLRERGKPVGISDSTITVTPARDWNRLDFRPGPHVETWTLDGEQLNDVTFYAGIEPGKPLLKEHNRKREPLPMFRAETLLIEVPDLLGNTYRAYKHIAQFTVTGSEPTQFLGTAGILFHYDYVDGDELPRRGEARAALVGGKLYMITFDAPRLGFFDRNVGDVRALVATAARGT